jgi:lipopolysaccharide biosynthesis protein
MGIATPLPHAFDFPNGTMFWARPAALEPLFALNLAADDYPAEPLPKDGTLLHALERLLPFAAEKAGYTVATTLVPGSVR